MAVGVGHEQVCRQTEPEIERNSSPTAFPAKRGQWRRWNAHVIVPRASRDLQLIVSGTSFSSAATRPAMRGPTPHQEFCSLFYFHQGHVAVRALTVQRTQLTGKDPGSRAEQSACPVLIPRPRLTGKARGWSCASNGPFTIFPGSRCRRRTSPMDQLPSRAFYRSTSSPFVLTTCSSFSAVPVGRRAPRSHWLTVVTPTLR